MNRRTVLGAAVVAGAAGAGAAWWRARGGPGDAGISDAAMGTLWSQSFETPGGGTLSLQSLRGSLLLLNFWATWCPPCLKEMPLLNAFHQQHQSAGWNVVGLAVDGPSPVREYLAKLPMSFPIGLAGMGGVELTKLLGNASGALPFTVVIDRSGKAAAKKLGALTPEDLQGWRQSLI